jgi:hypothetical protein
MPESEGDTEVENVDSDDSDIESSVDIAEYMDMVRIRIKGYASSKLEVVLTFQSEVSNFIEMYLGPVNFLLSCGEYCYNGNDIP